jgi:integral membrane sensor signal transduction histidine kinase
MIRKNKPYLKLTFMYASILCLVSIIFSTIIYSNTVNSFNVRPIEVFYGKVYSSNEKAKEAINKRDNEIKKELLFHLIVLDSMIIILGTIGSYFLSKKTLKPIEENLELQMEFISNASHELKTPITIISMENEVLLKQKKHTEDELVDQIKSNLEEVQNLSKLVNILLELARNNKITLEKVKVFDVANNSINKLSSLAKKKNITILNNITNLEINANKDILEEVMVIIIDNAIKYSDKNTTIKLYSKNNKIFIEDEGIGIKEKDIKYIFDRFYRGDKSHSSEGYGLGLSLAKHLTEKMKMKITAYNNHDKGSTFIIE